MFSDLFSNPGFMPHIHCYLDRPLLVWTMFVTNLMIGLSYFGISLTLWALAKKVRLQFNFVIFCFGVFIGACGLTHLLEIWTLWHPDYWVSATVNAITALASVGTAIYLFGLRHPILAVAEASKLSEKRKIDLETLTQSLEQKVLDRTNELQRTTDILNAIMSSTSDLVYLKDRQSRLVYCNPVTLKLFGKSEAEIYGKNDVEFLGPGNGGEEILKTDERIMSSGRGETAEERVVWSNGSRKVYLSRKEPHRDSKGNIIGLIGISTDITERKESERARQVTEVKLKTILEHVPVGIGVTDASGKLEYMNPKGTEIWADKRDVELDSYREYQAWDQVSGKRIESQDWAMAKAVVQRETTPPRMLKIKAFDGTEKFILDSGSPMFGPEGDFIGGVATAQEVTSLVQAERKLRDSEARFRQFADAIPQLGWIAQADGFIYWYNQNWYRYTGTTPQEMEGWGWQRVHDPKVLPRVLKNWKESISTGEPFSMEFPLKGADGQFRWFLTRVTPIKDENGIVTQWFGTNTDIHELRIYQDQLKEAVKARDEFLSIASHELRTPLTSLRLQTQLLNRDFEKNGVSAFAPEKVRTLVHQTDKQTARLARLVDDMLDISRIREGKLAVSFEALDLVGMIQETVERLKPQFVQAKAEPPTLELCDSAKVQGDRLRLEQVLANLLTNAIRYGDGKPVRLRLEKLGDRFRLSVIDQGIGIAPGDQQRIFNRFERAISANEISGLGLGLFITKQIVESHHGKIWVESKGVGQGSSFIIELPAGDPSH